jgi:hypothetical protein
MAARLIRTLLMASQSRLFRILLLTHPLVLCSGIVNYETVQEV